MVPALSEAIGRTGETFDAAFDSTAPRGVEGGCGSLGNRPAPITVAERGKEGNLPPTVSGLRYMASPGVATYRLTPSRSQL
jgi:hypothetical protein